MGKPSAWLAGGLAKIDKFWSLLISDLPKVQKIEQTNDD